MRIIDTTTYETIGTVIANQSLTIEQACELAGVDLDEHDIDDLHLSTYSAQDEIDGAEKCARESVKAGTVGGKIATDADDEPLIGHIGAGDTQTMPDGDYGWLQEKFGHVSDAMTKAYRDAWNSAIDAAESPRIGRGTGTTRR